MTTKPGTVDTEKVRERAQLIAGFLTGAVSAAMVHLGDALGLYRAMRDAGPLSSAQLAKATGLHERWLREWLRQQAAAGVLEYRGEGRFELSPETAMVVADEANLFSGIGSFDGFPQRMASLVNLRESFRTGIGLSFDDRGPDGARAIERMLAPTHRLLLVQAFLPALDGVVAKLQAGAEAADVGCGSGVAVIEMAKAFPNSRFHGYDTSVHALARAVANAAAAGVTNATFHNAASDPLPPAPTFDFVVTFDCLHDMTHPELAVAAIRRALRADGSWFIADVKGAETFEENLLNPAAARMYGVSVLGCMSASMSEPGAAGLGTFGLPEAAMRELVTAGGFSRFRRIPLEHPFNAYYEARP
jgi:SAM-dependent methyltransferase